jgi:phosphinothricin acetyltransferase
MHTRPATTEDGATIRAIYAPYVANTIYSFEFDLPSVDEICSRMTRHGSSQLWLVAEEDREILAYAYSWPFEEREGYRFTVETSIFVRQDRVGNGVGRKLYQDLLTGLGQRQYASAVARIALPNPQSQRLHEKLGFRKVAHFERIGHKFEQWIDVGYRQRPL